MVEPSEPAGWSNLIAGPKVVYVEHCCSDGSQPAVTCIDGVTGDKLQEWRSDTGRPDAHWGGGIAPTRTGLFVYSRMLVRADACWPGGR